MNGSKFVFSGYVQTGPTKKGYDIVPPHLRAAETQGWLKQTFQQAGSFDRECCPGN